MADDVSLAECPSFFSYVVPYEKMYASVHVRQRCQCSHVRLSILLQVEQEVRYQARRIGSHACLAIWGGNNEVEQASWHADSYSCMQSLITAQFTHKSCIKTSFANEI